MSVCYWDFYSIKTRIPYAANEKKSCPLYTDHNIVMIILIPYNFILRQTLSFVALDVFLKV